MSQTLRQPNAGADAGFRVRGGASGVSRISARGVLKVRPHTKSGGVVHFRSDMRKVGGGGGGGNSLQVRYEKWGGGEGIISRHRLTYYNFFVIHMLGSVRPPRPPPP